MSDRMVKSEGKTRTNVLGVGISALNMQEALDELLDARMNGQSGYVCVTGVHGVIESQSNPELRQIHNHSFMTVPDGMPTVWMGREQGFTKMGRVYGPDLMLKVFEKIVALNQILSVEREAVDNGDDQTANCNLSADPATSNVLCPSQDETGMLDVSVSSPNVPRANKPFTHFLYGATDEMLFKLKSNLEEWFPGVQIVGTYAPPFRPLNDAEEEDLRQIVADCQPDFFWVGLSTPKQERFMFEHCSGTKTKDGEPRTEVDGINEKNSKPVTSNPLPKFPLEAGIMLGVGAAFPIHAGLQKDAPEWIKNSGFQWFHRLCQEPRRLWRRYLHIIPTFLWLAFLQILGVKKFSLED